MSKTRCPNCGFSYKIPRYGEWIKNKGEYEEFWKDKPMIVKLAIEDYFCLKSRDPNKYTLQFTANHNEAEWIQVKRTFQELKAGGFVYNSYL